MIIVGIKGGLGNQLQQYALYRKFIAMGVEARVDLSWYKEASQDNVAAKRKVEMDYFPGVTYQTCTSDEKDRLTGGDGIIGRLKRKLSSKLGLPLVRMYTESSMYDMDLLSKRDYYLEGYFANEFYYIDILGELKKELEFPIDKSSNSDKLMEYTNKMKEENSVSIHLRRGDYLDAINQAMFGDICTDEYYQLAVDYVVNNVSGPKFYIFSDDSDYASEYAKELNNKGLLAEVIDINHKEESFYDIYLMSKCKHHITANSTFSFWGARLSDADGIKIRPSKQKNSQEFCEEMRTWWSGWTFISPAGELL